MQKKKIRRTKPRLTPIVSLSQFFSFAHVGSLRSPIFSHPHQEPVRRLGGRGYSSGVDQPDFGDCSQYTSSYLLCNMIHRFRGCRELEIKVRKLGQGTRGGLLAFQESFLHVLASMRHRRICTLYIVIEIINV